MKLILVRHGQTDENTHGIMQTYNSRLTLAGKKQAREVALKLKDEKTLNNKISIYESLIYGEIEDGVVF